MNELNAKTVRILSDSISRKISEVFGAILGKSITVNAGEVQKVTNNLMGMEFPTGLVLALSQGDKIPGSMAFWFTPEGSATIVDLMIMGDGSAPFNAEEHLDGISEAIHQVVESLALDWNNEGYPVSFKPVNSEFITDPVGFSEPYNNQLIIRLELEIEEFGDVGLWLWIDLALANMLMPPTQSGGGSSGMNTNRGGGGADNGMSATAPMNVRPAIFAPFDTGHSNSESDPRNLDLLLDVSLPVTIELGRTSMLIRDVLDLAPGSVVELDKLSGEPVDLYVNDRKFARGEVVVVDENFGVRITELMRIEERIKSLRG